MQYITHMKAVKEVFEPSTIEKLMGSRIRQIRNSHGWTLDELADRSNVSRRTLISIEQGSANASISTLLRITTAIGMSLAALVEDAPTASVHVKRKELHKSYWSSAQGGQALLVASTQPPDVVELWDWRLGPEDEYSAEAHSAGTRELIHVLQGKLIVVSGATRVELTVGDSVWFQGDQPHSYMNDGSREVRFSLAVHQPGVGS